MADAGATQAEAATRSIPVLGAIPVPALLFLLFFALGLLVARESLSYSWFHDDVHLVRTYSPAELLQTLTGNWAPDGIESRGYRPLTTLFNHTRALVLG